MVKLSVVILSFNTKDLLYECLHSLLKVRSELPFEVVVVDNASSDGSAEMVEKQFPWVKLIKINKNLGFAAGNNKAKNYCKGEYILFLNSDTVILQETLKETVNYLTKNKYVGALTCKILLPNGDLDKDARRSFITPWIGITHLFLKFDRLFPKSKFFARYWYGYINPDIMHEVDALQGAFFLTRRKVLDSLGWFDESYYLDGEDIDLSWKIKEAGWKIIYYPKVSIIHHKGSSKGKLESNKKYSVLLRDRLKFRMAGVNSMEIFYKKHLWNKYPLFINYFVLFGIKILKTTRFFKTLIMG